MSGTTSTAWIRRPTAALLLAGLAAGCGTSERADLLAITDVSVVDVDLGAIRADQTVLVAGDTIAAIGPSRTTSVPPGARRLDGRGRYLMPGLWDMHTHAHRQERAAWHYPAYLAHGVTGIRDAGTFADSAAAWRERHRADSLAPTVWWGSPPIDGVPALLSFGTPVGSPDEARAVARRYRDLHFQFLKVYDRIDPASFRALAAEARALGIPLEGHVPLRISPLEAVAAGQRTIEHLTLVLESCIPGMLATIAADSSRDSMTLLADGRLAASLARYDARRCGELFDTLATRSVWQVPTLVQLRGAFLPLDDPLGRDPRLASVPSGVRDDWVRYRADQPPARREAGQALYRRHRQLVADLHRAGVPILAGTDASDEPWVLPGASLHDELTLFVEAGLTPLAALRTATTEPARYRGEPAPLLAPGRRADLVLLAADPIRDIQAIRRIEAVVLRGRLVPRAPR
ncbi:MAG: amidohydrolase family protein [Gemmatimonadetes bacterium]|nr:amidohydrolase family protein [Gemmatimonadota bacterium]